MYRRTTQGIEVEVEPEFAEDRSSQEDSTYFWAYHITIRNTGSQTVQLRTRHWKIIDGRGGVREVRGPGVVGEEPTLRPGESFSYTSGVPLKTPSGIMSGLFRMEMTDGSTFDAVVPAFSLGCPYGSRHVN